MDPTYPLVPIASFIASFLALLVLLTSQSRQSWNMGVVFLSAWVSIISLLFGIQTVIWRDNADTNIAPVFCDISSRLQLGTLVAMPACTLIICRSLYNIARHQLVGPRDAREHRRELIINLSLVIGLPVILNLLYYVIQGSRFLVIEELGCGPAVVACWLTDILINGPALVIFFISLIYMSITVVIVWKHKRSMNRLFGRQSAVSLSLYLRLSTFGFTLLLISAAPILDFFPPPTEVYPGWSVVHTDWAPQAISAAEWHSLGHMTLFGIVWNKWINIWLAITTFGLFGLSHDARAAYIRVLQGIATWWGNVPLRWRQKSPQVRLGHNIQISDFRCLPSLDCTLPAPPPAVAVMPSISDTIKVAVTVERYADEDVESLAGSGPEREREKSDKATLVL